MTDTELLTKIKNGLGITGNFQDETIQVYIDEVKAFMESAGIKNSVIQRTVSVGCILQGVTDIWVEKRSDFSEAFKKRIIQLKLREVVATPTFTPVSGTTFEETQSVEIACATDGATIHYTTDGSTPTAESATYSAAITVSATTTIKAIAVKTNCENSEVGTATYTKQIGENNNAV